jgi:hypothetical protein
MRLSALFAGLLLASAAQAQSVVFSDDFNDGIVDPQWTVSFDPLQFWSVGEYSGAMNFDGLTAPFGAFDERYTFTGDVTLPGEFQMNMDFSWNDQSGFGLGENAALFVVRLYDSSGIDIATFTMDDTSTTDAGDFIVGGGSSTTLPSIIADSSATISLTRDGADTIGYSVDVAGGTTASGTLGTMSGTVAKIEFYISHTTLCGPCGPFLGQVHVDNIEVLDGIVGGGPSLATSPLTAGSTATMAVTGATPFGTVFLAYSLAGGGPTITPFGVADLSAPIKVLTSSTADVGGDAAFVLPVPGGASGVTVWFQALDETAGVFTNGLMETVL